MIKFFIRFLVIFYGIDRKVRENGFVVSKCIHGFTLLECDNGRITSLLEYLLWMYTSTFATYVHTEINPPTLV